MGRVPRWVFLVLAVAVAIPAASWAQEGDAGPTYVTVEKTECWRCHATSPYKDYPPLKNFYAILPPASAATTPGQAFDYTVQIQNTWGAEVWFSRTTLDLTNASSLAFKADIPPLHEERAITIQVDTNDPNSLTTPQRANATVDIPIGMTQLSVELRPRDSNPTGPDVTLRIRTPGGQELPPKDDEERGGTERFAFDDRATFTGYGYGNWTFEAEVQVLATDDPTAILNGTPPAESYEFDLVVDATAAAIEERVLSVPLGGIKVLPGQSQAVTFGLLGVTDPGEASGQTVSLSVDAWMHYTHIEQKDDQPDDTNTTRTFSPDIRVGPGPSLEADLATVVVVPPVFNGATMATVSEVIGYAAAMLLIASVWTGGMFGKASRRQLNTVFGSAKRRVAFHNFLSYGILLAASIHTVLFIIETAFYWTLGLIWGGIAILAMFGLGLTGAFQVQMIRKWSYGAWRWSHYALAIAAIVFSIVHGLLDGTHFGELREPLGWSDPLDPRDLGTA